MGRRKITYKYATYKRKRYRVACDGSSVFYYRRKLWKHTSGAYNLVTAHRGERVPCYLMVALAFHKKERKPGHRVHHIDHNKKNDYYENLQWVTHSGNIRLAKEFYKRKGRWLGGSLTKAQKEDVIANPNDAMDKYNISHVALFNILGKKIICR